MTNHDVLIVGGGPAGYASALYGAAAGLDVGLVESQKLGGTCLHVGCIPAKELLETASVFRAVKSSKEFGITASDPSIDMSAVQSRKQEVISKLAKGLEGTIKGRGINVYSGVGSLTPDGNVLVSPQEQAGSQEQASPQNQPNPKAQTELTGKNVILAAGSKPRDLPGLKIDGKQIVTSDHILSWDKIPESIAIIGAGAIGVEFASLFADLGSKVLLLEALGSILAGVDKDLAKVVEKSFKKRGIEIEVNANVTGYDAKKQVLKYQDKEFPAEVVVVCVGRRPFTDLLELKDTGVVVDNRGFVKVNEYGETDRAGIYAIGDLIKTPQLAHIGFAEGIGAIKHLLGEDPDPIDYEKVPWGIYCQPEVAFAGLSEEAATAAGYEIEVATHKFVGNGRAQIMGETDGLVKVVVERGTSKMLGVHMVGPWVTEQLGAGYLAVNWEAESRDVADFIFPHPTLSEMFSEAALSLTGRSLHA